ncbi:AAA family ATPase, partial [Candidatus Uhrbacteria bacterium]|nr:AAA family ATPase [Candidatus Uhrbacteria bacterium]
MSQNNGHGSAPLIMSKEYQRRINDLERTFISAILNDYTGEQIYRCGYLEPDDFFFMPYADIWEAMKSLGADDLGIDIQTVDNRLRALGKPIELDASYLKHVYDDLGLGSTFAESYARLIIENRERRQLFQVANTLATLANDETKSSAEALRRAHAYMTEQLRSQASGEIIHAREAYDEYYNDLERLYQGEKPDYISTGIADLDRLLDGGISRGDLFIVSGPYKSGKSLKMQQLGLNMASQGMKVFVWSGEMKTRKLIERAAKMETGMPNSVLRYGQFENDRDWKRFTDACEKQSGLPMLFNDKRGLKVAELNAHVAKLKAAHGLDVVIFDYIQIADAGVSNRNREQEVAYISGELKRIAMDHDVIVIAGSQLNEEGKSRESRAIMNDADTMLVLQVENDQTTGPRKVKVELNRNGPQGVTLEMFL